IASCIYLQYCITQFNIAPELTTNIRPYRSLQHRSNTHQQTPPNLNTRLSISQLTLQYPLNVNPSSLYSLFSPTFQSFYPPAYVATRFVLLFDPPRSLKGSHLLN